MTGYQQYGSSLTRYEGLKPGGRIEPGSGTKWSSLDGGGQPRRSGRIRPVSDKRRAKNRERREMVDRLYPERPRCSVPWCTELADDLHEPHSRAQGGDIADEDNQAPLCRHHHDLITFRPKSELQWAFDLGLRIDGWAARRGEVA